MRVWDLLLPLLFVAGVWVWVQRCGWFVQDPLLLINRRTAPILERLVQTKYFRIIRLNINQECQLGIMNRICKSQSCTVCRCNERDIPEFWSNNEKVRTHLSEGDLWALERSKGGEWVWHVEDEANDLGEYFDIHKNIESFTNYNGSSIWRLIYEQNCFSSPFSQMCNEEKILYNIIGGLHTSISTHLSRFYKHNAEPNAWADLNDEGKFHFNHSEYRKRVLEHPQRIRNLLFIYQILGKAVLSAAPYLHNFTIASDDFAGDVQAKGLLGQLLVQLQGHDLSSSQKESLKFFKAGNPMVRQYQKYIHNISNILNCVECEKCRLFGKMQTYGVGTALKILLGYPTPYKRNEIVALFNVFNKISMSVDTYYSHRMEVIPLGYEQTSRSARNILVVVAALAGAVYIWRRYRQQFCEEEGKSGQRKEE